MKREIIKNGPLISEAELKEAWIEYWENLPQERIQAWIERVIVHV